MEADPSMGKGVTGCLSNCSDVTHSINGLRTLGKVMARGASTSDTKSGKIEGYISKECFDYPPSRGWSNQKKRKAFLRKNHWCNKTCRLKEVHLHEDCIIKLQQ